MRQVRVTLFEGEWHEGDWPSEKPAEFLAWWRAKIDQIPQEFLPSALVYITSSCDHQGDHSPKIEITYSRPETSDEEAERLRREEIELAKRQRWERAEFERLKAKFEAP